MTLGRIVDALRSVNPAIGVEDVLDAFWLATLDPPLNLLKTKTEVKAKPIVQAHAAPMSDAKPESDAPRAPTPSSKPPAGSPPPEAVHPQETTPVYPSGLAERTRETRKASPVLLPAGQALAGRLALSRALRPLKRRHPFAAQHELDEQRTCDLTAELGGRLFPVFRPRQERWYRVDVVMEDDPAIGLWRATVASFCQVLQETGAFAGVRSWRLKLVDGSGATLESASGSRLPVEHLTADSARRVIFFVTHGVSVRWLDGQYVPVLRQWRSRSSVCLVHVLAAERWKYGLLDEPEAFCLAPKPGAVTSSLKVEKPDWGFDTGEEDRTFAIPITALSPAGLGTWASMQMGRSSPCPAVLFDPALPPDALRLRGGPVDFQIAVEFLRQNSLKAFRLAVYLSPGAFTLPVARIVQEAKFGTDAHQEDLGELLLSGLLFTPGSPESQNVATDPDEVYFDFHPQAREILLRSLREADAEFVANTLEQHVSRYMEAIHQRAVTFRALVPDAHGHYDLPPWAQPFARLGVSLLGEQAAVQRADPVKELRRFREMSSAQDVYGAARLATEIELGASIGFDPIGNSDPLLDRLVVNGVLLVDAPSKAHFLEGIQAPLRDVAVQEPLLGIRVSWFGSDDDERKSVTDELVRLGAKVDFAPSSNTYTRMSLALRKLEAVVYHIRRSSDPDTLRRISPIIDRQQTAIPTVLYAPDTASSGLVQQLLKEGLAAAHAVDRRSLMQALRVVTGRQGPVEVEPSYNPWGFGVLMDVLYDEGFGSHSNLFDRSDTEIAEQLPWELFAHRKPQSWSYGHLRSVQVLTQCIVARNYVVTGSERRLRLEGSVVGSGATVPNIQYATWDGLIGRALRTASTAWAENVAEDPDFLPNEASARTRSLIAIPYFSQQKPRSVVGIVSVEFDRMNALTEERIAWLEIFCAPLAAMVPASSGATVIFVENKANLGFSLRIQSDLQFYANASASLVLNVEELALNCSDTFIPVFDRPSDLKDEQSLPWYGRSSVVTRVVPVISDAGGGRPTVTEFIPGGHNFARDYDAGLAGLLGSLLMGDAPVVPWPEVGKVSDTPAQDCAVVLGVDSARDEGFYIQIALWLTSADGGQVPRDRSWQAVNEGSQGIRQRIPTILDALATRPARRMYVYLVESPETSEDLDDRTTSSALPLREIGMLLRTPNAREILCFVDGVVSPFSITRILRMKEFWGRDERIRVLMSAQRELTLCGRFSGALVEVLHERTAADEQIEVRSLLNDVNIELLRLQGKTPVPVTVLGEATRPLFLRSKALADRSRSRLEKVQDPEVRAALVFASENGGESLIAALKSWLSNPDQTEVVVDESSGPGRLAVLDAQIRRFGRNSASEAFYDLMRPFSDVFGGIRLKWPILHFVSPWNDQGVEIRRTAAPVAILNVGRRCTLPEITLALDQALTAQKIRLIRGGFLRQVLSNTDTTAVASRLSALAPLPAAVEDFIIEYQDELQGSRIVVIYPDELEGFIDPLFIAERLGFQPDGLGVLDSYSATSFRMDSRGESQYDFSSGRDLPHDLQPLGLNKLLLTPRVSHGPWAEIPAGAFSSGPDTVAWVQSGSAKDLLAMPGFSQFRTLRVERGLEDNEQ